MRKKGETTRCTMSKGDMEKIVIHTYMYHSVISVLLEKDFQTRFIHKKDEIYIYVESGKFCKLCFLSKIVLLKVCITEFVSRKIIF